jgi:hypothetical protein
MLHFLITSLVRLSEAVETAPGEHATGGATTSSSSLSLPNNSSMMEGGMILGDLLLHAPFHRTFTFSCDI